MLKEGLIGSPFGKGGYRGIFKSIVNTPLNLERRKRRNMKKIFLITLIFMTLIFKTIWAEEKIVG